MVASAVSFTTHQQRWTFDPTWWLLTWDSFSVQATLGQLQAMAQELVEVQVPEVSVVGMFSVGVGLLGLWWAGRGRGRCLGLR